MTLLQLCPKTYLTKICTCLMVLTYELCKYQFNQIPLDIHCSFHLIYFFFSNFFLKVSLRSCNPCGCGYLMPCPPKYSNSLFR